MIRKIILIIVPLMFFAGCGKEEVDLKGISDFYSELPALTMEASVRTNSGVIISYDIIFTKDKEGERVTILSPENLSGITAEIHGDRAEVVYKDKAVETLLPSVSGYVPADAVTGIIKDLGSGKPSSFGFAEYGGRETVKLTFEDSFDGGSVSKSVWIDRDDNSIIRAEFYLGNTMIMELDADSFIL